MDSILILGAHSPGDPSSSALAVLLFEQLNLFEARFLENCFNVSRVPSRGNHVDSPDAGFDARTLVVGAHEDKRVLADC